MVIILEGNEGSWQHRLHSVRLTVAATRRLLKMVALQRATGRAHFPAMLAMLAALGTVLPGNVVSAQEEIYPRESVEELPTPMQYSGSKSTVNLESDMMLNDMKKSVSSNEVFDGTMKGKLNFFLSELREIRTEIREARQEHSRLANGVAEISDQVKVIGDRKKQINKKIRKLTKLINHKENHRKTKGGIRSLQQEHARILQAMVKAKFLNHTKKHRNNRMNSERNDTDTQQNETYQNDSNANVGSNEAQVDNQARESNRDISKEQNNSNVNEYIINEGIVGEVIPESNILDTHLINIEKKTPLNYQSSSSTDELHTSPLVLGLTFDSSQSQLTTTITTGTTEATAPPQSTLFTTSTTTPEATTSQRATSAPLPANCYEVLQNGDWTSGVYTIQPGTLDPIEVR